MPRQRIEPQRHGQRPIFFHCASQSRRPATIFANRIIRPGHNEDRQRNIDMPETTGHIKGQQAPRAVNPGLRRETNPTQRVGQRRINLSFVARQPVRSGPCGPELSVEDGPQPRIHPSALLTPTSKAALNQGKREESAVSRKGPTARAGEHDAAYRACPLSSACATNEPIEWPNRNTGVSGCSAASLVVTPVASFTSARHPLRSPKCPFPKSIFVPCPL